MQNPSDDKARLSRTRLEWLLSLSPAELRELVDQATAALTPSAVESIGEVVGHNALGNPVVRWHDGGLRPIGMRLYGAPVMPSHGLSFEQVRDAIYQRMGGHTVGERDLGAWTAFLGLLKQVKPGECAIPVTPSATGDRKPE